MLRDQSLWKLVFGMACLIAFGSSLNAQVIDVAPIAPEPDRNERNSNVEVLTRGPIHEAFAEQYAADPMEGLVVPQQPPEPLDEVPPDVIPDGDNVEWIPGYWGWDDDREEFIWISGLWRDLPPGRRWIPGHWSDTRHGYRWSAGFWESIEVREMTYLPQPPLSQERGPNTDPPGANYFWIPGSWMYQQGDYRWRPGYWSPSVQNWVWIPARYVWTPRGYLYSDGYWDYQLVDRGVLFSPVYWPGYQGQRYIPQNVVPIGPLMVHLFVRPGYSHYYYGNYYDNSYVSQGIYPWLYAYNYMDSYYYDPIWSFYRYDGGRRNTFNRLVTWHRYFQNNAAYRPPGTFREFESFRTRINQEVNQDIANVLVQQTTITQPLNVLAESGTQFVSLNKLDASQRERLTQNSNRFRQLAQQRQEVELSQNVQENANANAEGNTKLELPEVAPSETRRPSRFNLPERPDARRGENSQAESGDRPQNGRNRERGRPDQTGRPDNLAADPLSGTENRPVQPGNRPAPRGERPETPGANNRPDPIGRPDTPLPGQPSAENRSDSVPPNPSDQGVRPGRGPRSSSEQLEQRRQSLQNLIPDAPGSREISPEEMPDPRRGRSSERTGSPRPEVQNRGNARPTPPGQGRNRGNAPQEPPSSPSNNANPESRNRGNAQPKREERSIQTPQTPANPPTQQPKPENRSKGNGPPERPAASPKANSDSDSEKPAKGNSKGKSDKKKEDD